MRGQPATCPRSAARPLSESQSVPTSGDPMTADGPSTITPPARSVRGIAWADCVRAALAGRRSAQWYLAVPGWTAALWTSWAPSPLTARQLAHRFIQTGLPPPPPPCRWAPAAIPTPHGRKPEHGCGPLACPRGANRLKASTASAARCPKRMYRPGRPSALGSQNRIRDDDRGQGGVRQEKSGDRRPTIRQKSPDSPALDRDGRATEVVDGFHRRRCCRYSTRRRSPTPISWAVWSLSLPPRLPPRNRWLRPLRPGTDGTSVVSLFRAAASLGGVEFLGRRLTDRAVRRSR